ncbi:hypothetical protein ACQR35_00480 [Pseudarthrobacter sp. J1738]|uniref:hypothetical protein n=1 Tax=unclassified Pseudarthrobacter TaxID=2647000 RepID=UPI003D2C1EC5
MISAQNDDGFELRVGDLTRVEIERALSGNGVLLNNHAQTLLDRADFDTPASQDLIIVERTVAELGFGNGAELPNIFDAAQNQGLELCPLVTGPYLRLVTLNQEAAPDSVLSAGRAPNGSVHVSSAAISSDFEDPKGFYLRVIGGQVWLRGYRCDDTYLFEPEQRFAFVKPSN